MKLQAIIAWSIVWWLGSAMDAIATPVPLLKKKFAVTPPAKTVSPTQAQRNPPPSPTPNPELPAPTEETPPLEVPATPASPTSPEVPTSPAPSPPPEPALSVPVSQIQVIGSTVFRETDFAPIIQPFEGRILTLEELRTVADAITQLYLDRGYITSRAVLVDQTIAAGVVQIRVIEGSLERIDVEGTRRLSADYVRQRIALGGGTPVSQSQLEDQLRLLRIDPLFENVEASLRPGTDLGQSILMVRVTEADPFFGTLGVDNYSPPSVGSERVGGIVGSRNLTGRGDEGYASYYRSTTGGANVFDFGYRVPLNPMNGALQLRIAPNTYRITDPEFTGLDITGNSELYELSYRQPLIRSPREELALSLGFSYQDGESLVGSELSDPETTSVIRFGQDYVRRDARGAWAVRSQFSFGTEWLDATQTDDNTPDGQYFSWLGQIQRVQALDTSNLLVIQLDMQFTPDALVPSQQFVIGGGQSVRGYQQNIRLGDNGIRFSIEDRLTLTRNEAGEPVLQLIPFVDLGTVWNDSDNPDTLPDQNFLAGVGVGVLWEMLPRLTVRLDAALPLVDLRDRGENLQDKSVFFSVNYEL